MINLLKALVILGLLSAIGGGAYGTYYLLVQAPRNFDAREAAQEATVHSGQPTPDPSTPDFEKAQALKRTQNYPEARAALEAFLVRYPDSSHHDQALSLLGDMNLTQLFSTQPGPDKAEYIVQRGDVLDRVAHKTKSDPELIYQANGLDRIMLRIGQKLMIPNVDFSIEVHLNPRRLVLLNHGKFFKIYPLLEVRPLGKKGAEIRTKVQEKLAKQNRSARQLRLARFRHQSALPRADWPARLHHLRAAGRGTHGNEKPTGNGLALDPSDAEELHSLVSVGTPVVASPLAELAGVRGVDGGKHLSVAILRSKLLFISASIHYECHPPGLREADCRTGQKAGRSQAAPARSRHRLGPRGAADRCSHRKNEAADVLQPRPLAACANRPTSAKALRAGLSADWYSPTSSNSTATACLPTTGR